ncbi:hypothetical protein P171DRAFT_448931 [Karstenula rhodostoma CBS 690.94]|uniref:Cytochrome P450 n=1 Tax=Karstenula rhodostoma CBS 690.94 TaxID=1392251 RepID=A0A9P4P8N3_9PLEO|nr:hypothetical protein P171DRAFT_448931 [Karstenula rhodostoma CBS 690.94]
MFAAIVLSLLAVADLFFLWSALLLQAKQKKAETIGLLLHVNTTADNTNIFTLNVLAVAILNKSYSYHGAADAKAEEKPDDNSQLYRDLLSIFMENEISILICGDQGLKAWCAQNSWKEVSNAIATLRSHVTGLINEERINIERGVQNNQHLVAAVVRDCERENREVSGGKRIATLGEEEIVSNMFVYAFAGNDTTALCCTIFLLMLQRTWNTRIGSLKKFVITYLAARLAWITVCGGRVTARDLIWLKRLSARSSRRNLFSLHNLSTKISLLTHPYDPPVLA